MTMKTDGIVIREQNTGDQDRLITILTREKGVIKAFANGVRNPKSKNVSTTGLFSYCDFSIEKTKRDVYIVKEATAKNMFFSLRQDVVVLSLAQYFLQLASELSPQEEPAREFLSLILNALHLLSQNQKNPLLIKAVLELRLLSLAGFMPNIVACNECGTFESEEMYFDSLTGEIFCQSCAPPSKKLCKVKLGVIRAVRHICLQENSKIFSFNLPDSQLLSLSELSESYLKNVTGHKYKTLEFYKSMT
ncbi:MAG: DNA repair protein RecO [Acutalibacteraceae bacterium]